MFSFQQCFKAAALSREFDLAEMSGPILAPYVRAGDEVTILVPERSRLVAVSGLWAGGHPATDFLWHRYLNESLFLRRCLIPVSGYFCEGKDAPLVHCAPSGAHLCALAGVLAWSPTYGSEVCVGPTACYHDCLVKAAPLPVAPAFRTHWCTSDASQDLIHLMEGGSWVQPTSLTPLLNDATDRYSEEEVEFSAYPLTRSFHYQAVRRLSGC
jgi:hypothetical protein